jgi:hypothetical protein
MSVHASTTSRDSNGDVVIQYAVKCPFCAWSGLRLKPFERCCPGCSCQLIEIIDKQLFCAQCIRPLVSGETTWCVECRATTFAQYEPDEVP